MTSPRFHGALGAAAALAASELAAAVLGLREGPVLAIAQSAIRLTPGQVAEPIIGAIGTADKPLAVVAVIVAMILLGSVIGAWWREHRVRALAGTVVLVGLATAAVLSRPYGSVGGVVACLAGGATLIGVLALLQREPVRADGSEATPAVSRRRMLRLVAAVAIATAVAGTAGELLASRRRRRRDLDQLRDSLELSVNRAPTPPGVDLGVQSQAPWRTSNRAFYRIDTALSPPLIDPAEWRLRIHGMVEREITVSYQDLLDRGLRNEWITLCCVSNPVGGDLISNTVFSGVPMTQLLDEVGVKPGADMLLSTSEDGWTCGTPLTAITDGRHAMLALGMDGVPLPVEHGFPVRQVVPGLYGYVSATKWVTELKVTTFAEDQGYWTPLGWSARGPIKIASRIDTPRGATADPGTIVVAGVAWAQHTGISAVEVQIDQDAWQPAQLAEVTGPDTWRQWKFDWPAASGMHTIAVRATDTDLTLQTATFAPPAPDGATGYHSIQIKVR